MQNLILFIHAGEPIEIEAAALARRDFSLYGYEVEEFSVVATNAHDRLKRLLRNRGDRVFCFYSMNFWALNIRNGDALLHEITGVPLVFMICDHPVYFLHLISHSLDGTILFLPGEELTDYVSKHYATTARTLADSGFRPHLRTTLTRPDFDDFSNRENMLLCPINLTVHGMNIDDVWATIKGLPTARRERARRLIDVALTDCITPLHLLSEALGASGYPESTPDDLRWVLNFIKLWRRTHIVRTLIDLPVLFSTNYVPAELESQYPSKFTLFTRIETEPLYRRFRFVLNSNPLIHCLHERVTETLINNAVCVTDRNAVLDRYFENGRDIVFFDYAESDLPERLTRLLDDPRRAFELTINSYNLRTERFPGDAHRQLIDAVEEMRG